MERQLLIRDVYAREILDPAGNLTIETEVLAGEDAVGRASAPSGVFSGRYDTAGPREEGGPGGERYCQEQRSRAEQKGGALGRVRRNVYFHRYPPQNAA